MFSRDSSILHKSPHLLSLLGPVICDCGVAVYSVHLACRVKTKKLHPGFDALDVSLEDNDSSVYLFVRSFVDCCFFVLQQIRTILSNKLWLNDIGAISTPAGLCVSWIKCGRKQ